MESDDISHDDCSKEFDDPFPNCKLSEIVARMLGENYVDTQKEGAHSDDVSDPFEHGHDVQTAFISYLGDFKYLFREPLPSIEESEFEDEPPEEDEEEEGHLKFCKQPANGLSELDVNTHNTDEVNCEDNGYVNNDNYKFGCVPKYCLNTGVHVNNANGELTNYAIPDNVKQSGNTGVAYSDVDVETQTERVRFDFDIDENFVVQNDISFDEETISVEVGTDESSLIVNNTTNDDLIDEFVSASKNQAMSDIELDCTKISWSVTSV
ncbi:hypothetical protein ACF0H5_004547 [Mactra antiquata]